MTTTTESILKGRGEHLNRLLFEQMMESFIKRWAPDDKYAIAQFDSELHALIRQVYRDAQDPILIHLEKIMSAAVACAPLSMTKTPLK